MNQTNNKPNVEQTKVVRKAHSFSMALMVKWMVVSITIFNISNIKVMPRQRTPESAVTQVRLAISINHESSFSTK